MTAHLADPLGRGPDSKEGVSCCAWIKRWVKEDVIGHKALQETDKRKRTSCGRAKRQPHPQAVLGPRLLLSKPCMAYQVYASWLPLPHQWLGIQKTATVGRGSPCPSSTKPVSDQFLCRMCPVACDARLARDDTISLLPLAVCLGWVKWEGHLTLRAYCGSFPCRWNAASGADGVFVDMQ